MNPYKLKPLGNRVVVKLPTMEETTEGGIIIDKKNQEPAIIGTVISIGKGVEDVDVNSVVTFPKYCPAPEYEYENQTYKIIDVEEITSVLLQALPVK